MKTEVVLQRKFLNGVIRQKSKSSLMSANDMELNANSYRISNGKNTRPISEYFKLQDTKELMVQICEEYNVTMDEVKQVAKGRNGGTWVHPLLLVDLGMWYSPKFKVKVLAWAMDNLCLERDNSGDGFKAMNAALKEAYPEHMNRSHISYIRVANRVAEACEVGTGKDRWNSASEEQLMIRSSISDMVIAFADVAKNAGECVTMAINSAIDMHNRRRLR